MFSCELKWRHCQCENLRSYAKLPSKASKSVSLFSFSLYPWSLLSQKLPLAPDDGKRLARSMHWTCSCRNSACGVKFPKSIQNWYFHHSFSQVREHFKTFQKLHKHQLLLTLRSSSEVGESSYLSPWSIRYKVETQCILLKLGWGISIATGREKTWVFKTWGQSSIPIWAQLPF